MTNKINLLTIINNIKPNKVINEANPNITGISYNSKTLKKGDIFICLVGEHVDGHHFAKQAEENGASAIIAQKELNDISIPTIIVEDTQYILSQVSAQFYNYPSKKLNLIGITGTNGKTTVTHLVENILEKAGKPCGLIGTLGHRFASNEPYQSTKHTTPQSPELQQALNSMVEKNLKYAVMEVSSHSLDQHRVGGCEFKGAVITNLTQDHLDYHITMDNYFKAKSKLFTSLKDENNKEKYAIINKDDAYAERFLQIIPENVKVLSYGIMNNADILAKNIEFNENGSKFQCITPFGTKNIHLQMTGMFSIYNALAAFGVGLCEEIDIDTCISALEQTKSVAGRFEKVIGKPLTIVDYAHTPDGLSNILKTARKIVPEGGNLICLFGCGGDRDATKRPKMGHIAEELADKVIVTSDNPRSEDPQQIVTDILTGIKSLNSDKITVEIDRRTAIELSMKISKDKDVIVLAGKGHEDYQILKNETIHFDDREEAKKAFENFYSKALK